MRFTAAICVLTLTVVFALARPQHASAGIKTVYVVVPTHLDIGFTAPPDTVARGYKSGIDHAIQLCQKYPDYFYTIECAWQLREWMTRSSPEEIRQLATLVKSGKVELGGAFATMHSGLMSGESVNRMFDLGLRLAKKLGGEIRTAIQDDVPGYTWAYPQALRQHGIKYFLTGINTSFGGKQNLSYKDVPFYWEGPDGSRVLTWIASGYTDGSEWGVGIWEKEDAVFTKARKQARAIEKAGYPYDAFLIMASPGDNVDASATEKVHRIIGKWNATEKSPVLKMATPREFFEYMEQKYADRFPTYRGDWSGHWAPAKLGAPRLIARMRHAQRILPVAEALWSVLALAGAARFPAEDIASTWDDLLTISGHTASAGTGWPNLTTKEQSIWENWQHAQRSLSASYSSSMLLDEGMEVLASSITADHPFIVVFNSLARGRSGYVEVKISPDILQRGLTIIDDVPGKGEKKVEYDLLEDGRTVRFLARGFFGLGYKIFRVAPGPARQPARSSETDSLKGHRFTISIDPQTGYICSIYDKTLQREWVEKNRLLGVLNIVPHVEAIMGGTSHPAEARASRVELIEGKIYRTLRVHRKESALTETSIAVLEYPYPSVIKIQTTLDTSKIPGDDRVVALLEFPFKLNREKLKIALDGPNHYRWWPNDFLPGTARIGQVVQSYALLDDDQAQVSFMPADAPILSLGKIGLHSLDKPRKARIYSYLCDRDFWGQNKDTGRTRYDEVEPALGTKVSFTYYLHFGRSPKSDQSRVSASGGWPRPIALEATVPLFARFHSPWGRQEGKLGGATARTFLMSPLPNIELSCATLVCWEDKTCWQLRLQENSGEVEYPPKIIPGFPIRSAWVVDNEAGERIVVEPFGGLLPIPASPFKTLTLLIEPDSQQSFRSAGQIKVTKKAR